ncbi:MAG: hypothetical protein ACE361_11835 [Aureliella sp.]
MAKRDSFLLRIDPNVLRAVRHWADDEMRSVNAQIEYLLRDCVRRTGRLGRDEKSNDDEKPNDVFGVDSDQRASAGDSACSDEQNPPMP